MRNVIRNFNDAASRVQRLRARSTVHSLRQQYYSVSAGHSSAFQRYSSSSSDAPQTADNLKRRETVMNVFDRAAKLRQRERTVALPDFSTKTYDYIRSEIGYRVADRIKDVSRKFETAVDLGCGKGFIAPHVYSDMVGKLHLIDSCQAILDVSAASPEVETIRCLHDEEAPLPFAANSLDLVVSSLSLHWVNDLPGVFRNIWSTLKPDGCMIAAMFGGESLFELRSALQLAELEREGGFSPHISPFTSITDLGNLLNRAGFTLLTMDIDELTVMYPSMFELMWDLKGMGETNAAWSRKLRLPRDTLLAAASLYRENYGNKDGHVPATFQILYMIGWKPHESQRKPAERGSGQVSLKDLGSLDYNKAKKKS
ncbi:arginine-hydroxylase NDUFAF5, mitochondrial-like [Paramacrobiotus metropolitanus]|uniref:arginine-hydroxylase NDUFAF5, mitochondrial-like n=1 Tax=Paramacrobiotus metropolitanus TaxID=2943436 RepID=UPI0024460133|nr:arginine-hydroxylase NDUFAF5, mitochondrial-like [Paramacrobiotus metropolitanus]XP_055347223.1 arginine-hydroxylase NDUFAF5, mitochondrial-like [Paramacrobiotus metropolitanus]